MPPRELQIEAPIPQPSGNPQQPDDSGSRIIEFDISGTEVDGPEGTGTVPSFEIDLSSVFGS